MTPSGVEPTTFRLVAQCLNQMRYQQRALKLVSTFRYFCNKLLSACWMIMCHNFRSRLYLQLQFETLFYRVWIKNIWEIIDDFVLCVYNVTKGILYAVNNFICAVCWEFQWREQIMKERACKMYALQNECIAISCFSYGLSRVFSCKRKERQDRCFHSCTVHLDTIGSFIYPTDAQIDCF
jgi:hypothetical protein